jgi:hypothetical protein
MGVHFRIGDCYFPGEIFFPGKIYDNAPRNSSIGAEPAIQGTRVWHNKC